MGRDRLLKTLNHEQPDRVCVDLGSTAVTGMHVNTVGLTRSAYLAVRDAAGGV
jgi:hypothetical protein